MYCCLAEHCCEFCSASRHQAPAWRLCSAELLGQVATARGHPWMLPMRQSHIQCICGMWNGHLSCPCFSIHPLQPSPYTQCRQSRDLAICSARHGGAGERLWCCPRECRGPHTCRHYRWHIWFPQKQRTQMAVCSWARVRR